MRILGIETSTPVVAVAVWEDQQLLGEVSLRTSQAHMESLLPLIDQLLKRMGVSVRELDAFAVASGPGSFTSLRIGMATAKALAHSLHKPLTGVPTLDLLAWGLKGVAGLICPMLTARKNEVYTAFYVSTPDGMKRLSHYLALAPSDLIGPLHSGVRSPVTFTGEGAQTHWELLQQGLGAQALLAESVQIWPRAGMVAELGWRQLQDAAPSGPAALHPLYVKQPAIRHN